MWIWMRNRKEKKAHRAARFGLTLDPASQRAGSLVPVLALTYADLEGESLKHCLNRKKRLPIKDALKFVREVADASQFSPSRRRL
jgi:hypothetical protein